MQRIHVQLYMTDINELCCQTMKGKSR